LVAYYLRSRVVIHHLLLGPGHVPSALSLGRLFNVLAPLDVLGFVTLLLVWVSMDLRLSRESGYQ
jgi:hypothetical protein